VKLITELSGLEISQLHWRGIENRAACLLYDILLPMTPEIISKLNEFLDTHLPFKEECEAVYLMVEVRKLLDREHKRNHFAQVRFYCDWTVHTSKDRNLSAIRNIMEQLEKSMSNGNPHPTQDAVNFFSLLDLREEMVDLFRRHGLRANLSKDDNHWKHFVDVLIPVLADQPITNPINGISSLSFVSGKIGTKIVTIEFTDQRTPLTFGIGE
jgi:hypothetical protein